MRLPKFEYIEPRSLAEACAALKEGGKDARLLAGGTDLLLAMKLRLETPARLINIKPIEELDYIREEGGAIKIGSTTSLRKVAASPVVRSKIPALAEAASQVGSPHHQVMGTIGGNLCLNTRCVYYNQSKSWRGTMPTCNKAGGSLCHIVQKEYECYATYSADTTPALIALGAEITLKDAGRSRTIALKELYTGDGKAPLAMCPEEILAEVSVPKPSPSFKLRYLKFRLRGSIDYPVAGVAVGAELVNGGKLCKRARIVMTAVGSGPIESERAGAALAGKTLSEELIEEAAKAAAKDAKPVKTGLFSAAYKRRIVEVLTQDALKGLLS